jgi:fumarylacetoacetate (FAA) hydrolase
MKLATLDDGTRDGCLLVVSRDGTRAIRAIGVAATLQAALDDWDRAAPELRELARALDADRVESMSVADSALLSPLPRAYEWVDGSAYINHIVLVRRARGAEPPATLRTDPLVYQGGSSTFLSPRADIPLADPAWGCDFESEVCVVLRDVEQGTSAEEASNCVALVGIANDVTLRNLVPKELEKGFGFFQSKPSTAFAPLFVTPDELGPHWREGRVHLPLCTYLNDVLVGDPNAGPEMHFSFFELIAHIAKTRAFGAGTVLGSGTVSNEDPVRGVSCLAERRMREILETGEARTPFLAHGDRVKIEMVLPDGSNVFGSIEQTVAPYLRGLA